MCVYLCARFSWLPEVVTAGSDVRRVDRDKSWASQKEAEKEGQEPRLWGSEQKDVCVLRSLGPRS